MDQTGNYCVERRVRDDHGRVEEKDKKKDEYCAVRARTIRRNEVEGKGADFVNSINNK